MLTMLPLALPTLLCLLGAALLLAPPAAAQGNPCEEEDFPIFNIPVKQYCSSASECPSGQGCAVPSEHWLRQGESRSVCSDYSAGFNDKCDRSDGSRMASPGCRQGAELICDVVVCRKQLGGTCEGNEDCIGGTGDTPEVLCVERKCQQYGFVERCSTEGERCSGGQVCSNYFETLWTNDPLEGLNYACFNRADRGETCKGFLHNSQPVFNGYKCKEPDETADLGYALWCDGPNGFIGESLPSGVCRSGVYEEGAACDENILCSGMDCVNGKCQPRDEAPGNECSGNSDCSGDFNGAPLVQCFNGRCVLWGYVGVCFRVGDVCPGGQTCSGEPSEGGNRNSCINRAALGEPCITLGRRDAPVGYQCKPESETGYAMGCKHGSDARVIPGPGPGGAGGSFAGTGRCMKIAEDGTACGDDILVRCDFSSNCVDGQCQKQ